MRSCVYEGHVRHRRLAPVEHAFDYRLFLVYLELDELDRVFEGRWLWSARRPAPAWFRRADYLGDPSVPLDAAVRDLVEGRTGVRPTGAVGVLTHLRYFGYCFNPVSFYYCWDAAHERVETIVAEIENTPWRERHAYVLPESENLGTPDEKLFRFEKRFHISPFMGMDVDYEWRLSTPGARAFAHVESTRDGERLFDATLSLERREIAGPTLARLLLGRPPITVRVMAAIYWNALLLWWKRAPFFPHPRWREAREEVKQ